MTLALFMRHVPDFKALQPLQIHLDGAQYADTQEQIVPLSWSPLNYDHHTLTANWETCFLVTAIVKRSEANYLTHGEATWEAIMGAVDPDFKALACGTRVQKFGGFIYNCCVDLSAICKELKFPSHSSVPFCTWCRCTQGGPKPQSVMHNCKSFNFSGRARAGCLDTKHSIEDPLHHPRIAW